MSFRRLVVLTRGLPAESQTARSLGAPRPGEWTVGDYLSALIADQLAIANHLFVRAHTRKGTNVPKPMLVPRPGTEEAEPKRPATPAELARALGKGKGVVRYHPKGHG